MLEFINNNGVLFSGLFSIAGVVITVLVSLLRDNMKNRVDTVQSLRRELETTRSELQEAKAKLHKMQSIDNAEQNIDKTHGTLYYETFANGGSRTICGFCWEKEHIRIPVVTEMYYDEEQECHYYDGFCNSCKTHCIEYIEPDDKNSSAVDTDLDEDPF